MEGPDGGRPRVVAIGGGHGLAASLAAVRRYAGEVTAIVSVADDGGSSGRLREDYGVPPPGDVRRCLVALAEAGSPWVEAFEHRFEGGELGGHALGNLVIAGLAATMGSFEAALGEAGRILGVSGTVLPATTEAVVLKALVWAADGTEGDAVEGQVAVAKAGGICAVSLVPGDAQPPAAAAEALARADQVVIGPGSLFTSVLAVVAVPALREALAATSARKVYVCNLAPQVPETAGYDVAAHVDAMRAHGLEVHTVLCHPGSMPLGRLDLECVQRPVARADGLGHDPVRLADALSDLVV
ncbi:MAG: gluconeogenesis factor YvcK family protein [Acidimicrobiales bacterium]